MGQRFNLQRVLTQLRYTGILDTVRVRASGYIIRKKYEDFAHLYVHPCNLLDEGNSLQGGLSDMDFSEKLRGDADLSKEVIRALFGKADYKVPKDEWLEGKTMIFVKKLNTLQTLNKVKEDMMIEVIKREKAKERMGALALKCLFRSTARHCLPGASHRKMHQGQGISGGWCPSSTELQISTARRLQKLWRMYLNLKMRAKAEETRQMILAELKRRHDIEAAMLAKVSDESGWHHLDTPDGERWMQTDMGKEYLRSDIGKAYLVDKERKRREEEERQRLAAEAEAARIKAEEEAEAARLKAMAKQLSFAEAYGMGWFHRFKYSKVKAEAIAEAKAEGRVWKDGGGGLLKRRKKRASQTEQPSEAMKKYVETMQNDGGAASGGIALDRLGPALAKGADAAARASARSEPCDLESSALIRLRSVFRQGAADDGRGEAQADDAAVHQERPPEGPGQGDAAALLAPPAARPGAGVPRGSPQRRRAAAGAARRQGLRGGGRLRVLQVERRLCAAEARAAGGGQAPAGRCEGLPLDLPRYRRHGTLRMIGWVSV